MDESVENRTKSSGPTLREFWLELKRREHDLPEHGGESGSGFGSGSGGSGFGGGYGLRLVVPDDDALARIRRIMRELCEADEERRERKKNKGCKK